LNRRDFLWSTSAFLAASSRAREVPDAAISEYETSVHSLPGRSWSGQSRNRSSTGHRLVIREVQPLRRRWRERCAALSRVEYCPCHRVRLSPSGWSTARQEAIDCERDCPPVGSLGTRQETTAAMRRVTLPAQGQRPHRHLRIHPGRGAFSRATRRCCCGHWPPRWKAALAGQRYLVTPSNQVNKRALIATDG
jgi:hypothetical protein